MSLSVKDLLKAPNKSLLSKIIVYSFGFICVLSLSQLYHQHMRQKKALRRAHTEHRYTTRILPVVCSLMTVSKHHSNQIVQFTENNLSLDVDKAKKLSLISGS